MLCSRVLLSVLLLSLAIAPARASETTQTGGTHACGKSIQENLAAARQALQSNDTATRAALVCIAEATAALNERVENLDQGRSATGELRAPFLDFPPPPSR
jgi:aminoglycoside phosphotransferase family enzyme